MVRDGVKLGASVRNWCQGSYRRFPFRLFPKEGLDVCCSALLSPPPRSWVGVRRVRVWDPAERWERDLPDELSGLAWTYAGYSSL